MPDGLGSFGSFGAQQDDVLAPYKPSPQEVQAELKRRDQSGEDESLFTRILSAPGHLLGADMVRGFVAGTAQDGVWEGLKQAWDSSPLVYIGDVASKIVGAGDPHNFKPVTFADMRAAFGDVDQSGFVNGVLNFLGDVATDPSSFVTLFGKVGSGLQGATKYASIAKSLEFGERAALVFKYPLLPAVAFKEIPVLEPLLRTMGLRSMSLNVARGIDNWASWMRTGAFGDLARMFSINMPKIGDPELARSVTQAGKALREMPPAIESTYLQIFAQMPREAQEYVLADKGLQRVLREMRERGFQGFDEAHRLDALLQRPTNTLMSSAVNATDAAEKAAGVPLATSRTAAQAGTLVQQAVKEGAVLDAAHAGLRLDLDTVLTRLRQEPSMQQHLDGLLKRQVDFMEKLGDKEMAAGILDHQMELYVHRNVNPAAAQLINRRFETALHEVGQRGLDIAQRYMKGREFTDLTTVEVNALMAELGSSATGFFGLKEIGAQAGRLTAEADKHVPVIMRMFEKVWDRPFLKRLRELDPDTADFFTVNPIYADFVRARAAGVSLGTKSFVEKTLSAMSRGSIKAKDLASPEAVAETERHLAAGNVPVIATYKTTAAGQRVLDSVDPLQAGEFALAQAGGEARARFVLQKQVVKDRVDEILSGEKADVEQVLDSLKEARDLDRVKTAEIVAAPTHDADGKLIPNRPTQTGNRIATTNRRMTPAELEAADLSIGPNDDLHHIQMKNALHEERLARRQRNVLSAARQTLRTGNFPTGARGVGTAAQAAPFLDEVGVAVDAARSKAQAVIQDGVTAATAIREAEQRVGYYTSQLRRIDEAEALATKEAQNAVRTVDRTRQKAEKAQEVYGAAYDRRNRRISPMPEAADMELAQREGMAHADARFTAAQAEYDTGTAAVEHAAAQQQVAWREHLTQALSDAKRELEQWQTLKGEAKLAKSPGAEERLMERYLREAQDGAEFRYKSAVEQSAVSREVLADQIAAVDRDYRQFADSLGADRKRAYEALQNLKLAGKSGQEAAQFVRAQRAASQQALLDWNSLSSEQRAAITRRMPDAEIHFMNPDEVKGVNGYFADLTRPDPLRKFGLVRSLDNLTGAWKAWTVGNVAFMNARVRDHVTGAMTYNMARGFWSGLLTYPSAWWDARKAAKAFSQATSGGGSLDDIVKALGEGAKIRGVAHADFQDVGQVIRYLADHGALDSGAVRDSIMESYAQAVKIAGATTLKDFNPLTKAFWSVDPRKSPWTRKGYQVANYGDNWAKIAGFIDGLKHGDTPEAALDFVRKWTYNPGYDATSFSRNFYRRAVPFGEFQRWAVSRTTELFFTKPGTVSWFEKLQRNAERAQAQPENIDAVVPDFVQDGMGVPYRNTESGPAYFLLGGWIPMAEVSKLANAVSAFGTSDDAGEGPGKAWRYLVNQLHPAVKMVIEQTANRDSFSGAEIKAYEGQTREMFGVAMPARIHNVLRSIRLLSEVDRLNVINLDQMRIMADAVERGTTLDSRAELSFAERAAFSAFSPLPVPKAYQIDVAEEVRRKAREAEVRKSETIGRLRATVERAPAGPKREANVEALRKQLLDDAARAAQVREVGDAYNVQLTNRRKAARTMSFGRFK